MSRRVIWISRRHLTLIALLVVVLVAAFALFPRQSTDGAMFEPAKRIAKGLGTQDIYLRPDDYKTDLTWSAYQQVLAAAPQYRDANASEPFNLAVSKYGTTILLDQGVFGDSVTALVQTFVKQKSGTVTLVEFQLQMIPEGQAWKVNNVTTLVKGTVP